MANGAVKVTISLPHNLVVVADEVARERKTSRSKVITSLLPAEFNRRAFTSASGASPIRGVR